MTRINREYLDSALGAVNLHTDALIAKYKARNHAAHSASQAVMDAARANLFWRKNISLGIMIATIMIGFGLMILLVLAALPGFVRALNEPVAPLSQTLALEDTQAGEASANDTLPPSPSDLSGPADQSETPIPAVIVPTYARDTSSSQCIRNGSFDAPCNDTVLLQNGANFFGFWRDGAANGEGTISFNDGGSITGLWVDGVLTEILGVTAPEISSAITSSVTFFSSVSGSEINHSFGGVTTGHVFSKPSDPNWSYAYCYLTINDGRDSVRVDLSHAPNFNAQILLDEYTQNSRIAQLEFERAQQMCSYQYTNF